MLKNCRIMLENCRMMFIRLSVCFHWLIYWIVSRRI